MIPTDMARLKRPSPDTFEAGLVFIMFPQVRQKRFQMEDIRSTENYAPKGNKTNTSRMHQKEKGDKVFNRSILTFQ